VTLIGFRLRAPYRSRFCYGRHRAVGIRSFAVAAQKRSWFAGLNGRYRRELKHRQECRCHCSVYNRFVSLAQLTKTLAQQAVGDSVKEALDAFRPAETPAASEPPGLAAQIIGQVQAMQNALKDDQELLVVCTAATETLRVLEFFTPSQRVVVMTGVDADKTVTRVICPAESLQLVCKPVPVQPGGKATRVRFVTPRPTSPPE
jgi:hypothetical protein